MNYNGSLGLSSEGTVGLEAKKKLFITILIGVRATLKITPISANMGIKSTLHRSV